MGHDHPLISWAKLVRLPNVLTVWADSTAAFALVVGGAGLASPRWWGGDSRLLLAWLSVLLSITAMYWGGMILNDVFDVRSDRRARSERPLPKREIPLSSARRAGWASLLVAVFVAAWLGMVPLIVSLLLAVCVVAYDGPLKRSPVATVLMGSCRWLSFLFAASVAWVTLAEKPFVAPENGFLGVAMLMAAGMGVFIFGITTFARREAIGDRTFRLPLGWVGMGTGMAMIALAPQWSDRIVWRLDETLVFPIAIALMGAPTLWRGMAAMKSPSPKSIQQTIVTALSTIIPLSAAITMLAVGAEPAIAVFALIPLSQWLRGRFQVT